MTLGELFEEAAAGLAGVTRATSDAGVEYRVGGEPFAAVGARQAEFRLAPAVARAAASTPDVARSARGADWIVLRPRELDRMARDRAVAWFGSAYRLAAGKRP